MIDLSSSLGDAENGGLSRTEVPAFFQDLQAGILRAHGRDRAVYALIKFPGGERAEVAAWISALCDGTALGIPLTSAREQSAQASRRRLALEAGVEPRQEPLFSFWFSNTGWSKMGLAPLAHAPVIEGMAARGALLGDPSIQDWDNAYKDLDAVVVIATDDAADLSRLSGLLVQSAGAAIGVELERCAVRRNGAGLRIEPFGFVDGVSDLDFWATRAPETPANLWAPLDMVLTAEGPPGRYGTFVVMRKLLQDVYGWNRAVEELTAKRTEGSATADEIELTAAMIIGRFRDGTPIVSNAAPMASPDPANEFTYSADPFAAKCPAYAHIRKTNPRGGSRFESLAEERSHRIVRRGMPLDNADQAEGLMFVCFQANITLQFEFIQRVWASSSDFPFAGTGRDLLIGRRSLGGLPDVDRRWPAEWGGMGARWPFSQFVRLTGGAYLYAPSIPTLLELAGGS